MLESSEWLKIIYALQGHKNKHFIFFSAYEKDANFISYLVTRRLGLTTQFIPSSNPLGNFYKKVVCTTFTFTAPYHKIQFEKLKENWLIEQTLDWPLFSHQKIKKYKNLYNYSTPPFTLGFMSSGNWLRAEHQEQEFGIGERESEKILIGQLRDYKARFEQLKITVFLHPYEKKTKERIAAAKKYYSQMLNGRVNFAETEKSSLELFDTVDVAIAVYSSVLFERLYAGFKSVFTPFKMPLNYFDDERLLSISIYDPADFESRLTEILAMEKEAFFKNFRLDEYRS